MLREHQESSAKIAILGSGSWGATLARVLALAGRDVAVWSRDEKKAQALSSTRIIERPISVALPDSILISSDLDNCLRGREIIIFACTSQSMRSVAEQVKSRIRCSSTVATAGTQKAAADLPVLVSASKGLELESFSRMSQVLSEILPSFPVCSLSGPNLAIEILKGLPSASVIACRDEAVAKYVQTRLSVPGLRMYSNTDITGVELGGSFKNVIAIAAGALDELELGANAKAALLTRGLAEMTRIAVTLGARAATLSGLAGLGDLLATCSSELSRNYRLGKMIARGLSLAEAVQSLGAVAEGVNTATAVCSLAAKMSVELPIAMQVEAALAGEISTQEAIMNLMTRPLVSE